MIRLLSFVIVLCSCTLHSGGQKAFHMDNKGITSSACLNSDGSMILAGETSAFAQEVGKKQKDGLLVIMDEKTHSTKAFSVGDGVNNFRLEDVEADNEHTVCAGYGFENKIALVTCLGKNHELKWSYCSDQLQGFEEPQSAMDKNGNVLFVTKKPDTTPYYGVFSLFSKEGKELWTRKIDHIDVMSDIYASNKGDFILNYKEKGAYIDGGTRKKYYICPMLRVNLQGEITQQVKFLVEHEKFIDLDFHHIVETKSGDVYFLGGGLTVFNRTDLLIVKTNSAGHILWSSSYQTNQELKIKSACLNEKEELVIAADSYGHSGGMMRAAFSPKGDVLWNSFNTSTPYEQVKAIFPAKESYLIAYDKTLSFAWMKTNASGESCIGKTSVAKMIRSDAGIIISNHNAMMEATLATWRPCELKIKEIPNVKFIADCGE